MYGGTLSYSIELWSKNSIFCMLLFISLSSVILLILLILTRQSQLSLKQSLLSLLFLLRSNSDSSVDEGIGPDILADVSVSLQSTPSKNDLGKNSRNVMRLHQLSSTNTRPTYLCVLLCDNEP